MANVTRQRAPRGTALATLRRLAAIETDECTLWPHAASNNGYGMVSIGDGCERTHAVVCSWIHGARPQGHEAAHACGRRLCVNPRHLRWATPMENAADRRRHGTMNIGERNGISKLTASEVSEIRQRREAGESVASLAAEHGLSHTYVRVLCRRLTWKHVA